MGGNLLRFGANWVPEKAPGNLLRFGKKDPWKPAEVWEEISKDARGGVEKTCRSETGRRRSAERMKSPWKWKRTRIGEVTR